LYRQPATNLQPILYGAWSRGETENKEVGRSRGREGRREGGSEVGKEGESEMAGREVEMEGGGSSEGRQTCRKASMSCKPFCRGPV